MSNYCSENLISTMEKTIKAQQKLIDNIENSKNYFSKKENMQNYLNVYCPSFNQQFELLNFLKNGSVGHVYEGKYKCGNNNQKYAIKFCIKKKREEKEDKNKFQEIAINKKLHHKNINQILAFIKMTEGSFFSVLEFGKHGDLDYFVNHFLKRKTLSETCILYFAKQILDSLLYLNSCKIIHMDIKQGNILIDSELNPKIIDFSASCSFSEFNPDDIVKFPHIGTGKYIAPEVLNRTHMKIKYGERIDIYSFGVTLYYLCFGIFPYNKKNEKNEEENKVLEFPKDIKISEIFKDFLTKVLERDYLKRIGIKEALNHPWIKGWQIIEDEKLNISCLENFLIKLVTDNIPKLNEYIKKVHNEK